ncbi:MAG: FprA family A-type flavoprotein [Candidatus Thorarchaeota archaeon]|nr:MAG: FprA family A-type flavoprotein [Candidatus Thorarchaeota archaeon]
MKLIIHQVKGMHREITKGIYYIGVDDHHTELFENLWSLPFGVSYNSYLIVDEKIALIETVKGPWSEEWLNNIRELVDPSQIDYIILNHMEPDHTSSLPDIAALAPNATLMYTPKAAPMQKSFYDVPLKEKLVEDLEELNLGSKTLKFVHAPFLHWPETVMTYVVEDEVVFSCDAFGSFGALNGNHFDDETDLRLIEKESRRYVSAIITSYFKFVQRALERVKELGIGIKVIAPSHGPIYRKDPMWIVNKYDEWTRPELEKYCTIVYGTMYGYTHRLAINLKKELLHLGVEVKLHNVSYSDMSHIITDSVRASVLVVGTPTYDAYPYPKVWSFVNEVQGKRFPVNTVALFGTYGWGGGGVKKLQQMFTDMKKEILEPIIRVKARASEEENQQIKELAKTIADRIN